MHTRSAPRTCTWDIDGLRYAGLEWGEKDDLPVLALHGWMDHADSFRELAPRLTGCYVVSIDLSGHGLSDHRAAHATYNIWDDLPQIAQLLDLLGWSNCILIGHSRGANIASLFAAAQPERVRALVTLDCLVTEPSEASVVDTLRAFIEQTRKMKSRPPRSFSTKEAYEDRRRDQGNAPHVSAALADRALEQVGSEFQLRGDARHFASSAVKLTQEQVEDVMCAIQCPVLNIWAQNGLLSRRHQTQALADKGAALIAHYERLDLPGDHHFHLDPNVAERMARAITDFLTRHNIG